MGPNLSLYYRAFPFCMIANVAGALIRMLQCCAFQEFHIKLQRLNFTQTIQLSCETTIRQNTFRFSLPSSNKKLPPLFLTNLVPSFNDVNSVVSVTSGGKLFKDLFPSKYEPCISLLWPSSEGVSIDSIMAEEASDVCSLTVVLCVFIGSSMGNAAYKATS